MDKEQIYEAIRQAGAAGDRQAVIKLNAYLQTLKDQEVAEPETSGVMPGALGAAGAVFGGGKALEAGVKTKYPYDVNAPVTAPTTATTVTPAQQPTARAFQSPSQVAGKITAPVTPGAINVKVPGDPGIVNWARQAAGMEHELPQKLLSQVESMRKSEPKGAQFLIDEDLKKLEKIKQLGGGEYQLSGSGKSQLMLPPGETAAKLEEANQRAQQAAKQRAERLMKAEELRKAEAAKAAELKRIEAAKAAEAASSPKEVAKRATQKAGNVMHKATSGFIANPLLRAATGFGAGYGISDAAQRADRGDFGRALISGAGALGDIAAMSRHPIAMPIGAAVGTAAPLLNMYLDELEKEGKMPLESSLEKLEEKAKPKKKMKEGGLTAAWQRSEGKNPEGGLNAAGRASYKRETGGELKPPVSAEAAKKSPKKASRRKSFCARMSGMKKRLTSAKTANDPDSRINKALRKWDC